MTKGRAVARSQDLIVKFPSPSGTDNMSVVPYPLVLPQSFLKLPCRIPWVQAVDGGSRKF